VIPSARLLAVTQPVPEAAELGLRDPLDLVEYAGRWDYGSKSIAKMGDRAIIRRWIDSGELSMVEMIDAVFLVTCSRVVSHELVRHRIASYQQESQRFTNHRDDDFDDLFFVPPEVPEDDRQHFRAVYNHAQNAYIAMLAVVPKQIARYVLPNATRTRIVVKMNLREWRHVLLLRLHPSAQPEMQEVMRQVHAVLVERFPEVFGDVLDLIEKGRAER
jgi:thymidylate synthase (FAD)